MTEACIKACELRAPATAEGVNARIDGAGIGCEPASAVTLAGLIEIEPTLAAVQAALDR